MFTLKQSSSWKQLIDPLMLFDPQHSSCYLLTDVIYHKCMRPFLLSRSKVVNQFLMHILMSTVSDHLLCYCKIIFVFCNTCCVANVMERRAQ